MAASSKTASARSETKLVQELADILDKSGLGQIYPKYPPIPEPVLFQNVQMRFLMKLPLELSLRM